MEIDTDILSLRLLMFVPVMCVRPVRVNMVFFNVLVFVDMWLTHDSYMLMVMMNIAVVVQMRVNFFFMQVEV